MYPITQDTFKAKWFLVSDHPRPCLENSGNRAMFLRVFCFINFLTPLMTGIDKNGIILSIKQLFEVLYKFFSTATLTFPPKLALLLFRKSIKKIQF